MSNAIGRRVLLLLPLSGLDMAIASSNLAEAGTFQHSTDLEMLLYLVSLRQSLESSGESLSCHQLLG